MGKRSGTAELTVPYDVLEAAAERANREHRSLWDVAATLLRDYAEGRTWLNLPEGSDAPPEEAAEVVRPPRTIVVDIARSGAGWIATSDQLEGFLVVRAIRSGIEEAAREDLAGWLDPAVTLEFREKP